MYILSNVWSNQVLQYMSHLRQIMLANHFDLSIYGRIGSFNQMYLILTKGYLFQCCEVNGQNDGHSLQP